jgi:hypothetical protein
MNSRLRAPIVPLPDNPIRTAPGEEPDAAPVDSPPEPEEAEEPWVDPAPPQTEPAAPV